MAGTATTWEQLLAYTWEECAGRTWDNVTALPYGVRQAFASAKNAAIVEGMFTDNTNAAASSAATSAQQYTTNMEALRQAIAHLDGSLSSLAQTCG